MSSIKFENIPSNLRSLAHWALYTQKKVPIKLSAVARGWPEPGWDRGLEGDAAKAGARSNDPSTWGLFEDCERLWHIAQERTSLIVGPAFALAEDLGITVIDLDDVEAKAADLDWKTEDPEIKANVIKGAKEAQEAVLSIFAGHYIERSISGRGYHIFVQGRLPQARYRFSFHGSVFSAGQFINLTGDLS